MSLSVNAAVSARASYDDGNWCGTKPGPRPHFDLGSVLGSLIQHPGTVQGDEQCGNGIIKHFPPPPPPPLGDLAGQVSHQVMNMLMG
jgi:hypothetical protein